MGVENPLKLEDAFQTGNRSSQGKPDTSAFSVATNYFMLDAKAIIKSGSEIAKHYLSAG